MNFIHSLVFIVAIILLSGCSVHHDKKSDYILNHKQNRLSDMNKMLVDLNSVIYARHKSELERDDDRKRYISEFASTLKTMSSKIIDFPKVDSSFIIDKDKVTTYNELAKKLFIHGESLQNIADSYDFKNLSQEIVDIESTCLSCHKIVHLQSNPIKDKIIK